MSFFNQPTKRILAGKATIATGNASVNVSLGRVLLDYAVCLTPTANFVCWVSNKTPSGFTINVNSAPSADLVVYYLVREI
jgi:hypothetical protein